jgi:DNA polymerase-1
LFEKLKISPAGIKRTSTGKISTAASELEKLRVFEAHPIIDHILTYRECTKLLSTYVKGLIKEINPRTNRIHTDYLQHGTEEDSLLLIQIYKIFQQEAPREKKLKKLL